jgi:hypothetical protein
MCPSHVPSPNVEDIMYVVKKPKLPCSSHSQGIGIHSEVTKDLLLGIKSACILPDKQFAFVSEQDLIKDSIDKLLLLHKKFSSFWCCRNKSQIQNNIRQILGSSLGNSPLFPGVPPLDSWSDKGGQRSCAC